MPSRRWQTPQQHPIGLSTAIGCFTKCGLSAQYWHSRSAVASCSQFFSLGETSAATQDATALQAHNDAAPEFQQRPTTPDYVPSSDDEIQVPPGSGPQNIHVFSIGLFQNSATEQQQGFFAMRRIKSGVVHEYKRDYVPSRENSPTSSFLLALSDVILEMATRRRRVFPDCDITSEPFPRPPTSSVQ